MSADDQPDEMTHVPESWRAPRPKPPSEPAPLLLKKCDYCQGQIAITAPACPHCGAPAEEPEPRRGLPEATFVATVVAFLTVLALIFVASIFRGCSNGGF